ncbi:MAG: calcium-binding protein, partial [Marivita sp.]
SGMDGNDRLEGGDGRDHLDGGAGRDSLSGGLDDDVLDGGDDRDVLQGGDGDDVLEGRDPTTPARDYLNGGEGDDTVTPGGGDIVSTGRGDDEIMLGHWLADQGPATVLDFEAGKDMLVIRIGSDPAPDVTARAEGGDTQLFLDGAHVATLTGLPDLPDGSVRFI